MHELIKQLYEQVDQEILQLLQRDADLIITTDSTTGKERLEIETSSSNLLDYLEKQGEIIGIGDQIQQLPSDNLKAIAYSNALIGEWRRARKRNSWIAKFFVANCLLLDSTPLVTEAKAELGKHGYELAHTVADFIRSLWELLDAGHPYIQKLLTKKGIHYPFQTSRDLLAEILKAEEDSRFIAKANDCDVDSPKWAQFWKFISQKLQNFNKEDLEKLGKPLFLKQSIKSHNKFYPEKDSAQWFEVALLICHFEARSPHSSHVRLKRKLNVFYQEIEEFATVQAQNGLARTAEGKVCKSVTWYNGEPFIAGKWGNRPSLKIRYKTL